MASAAILVGGQARRFGGLDKSTLVVGGRTILDYQIRELSQIADDILLVGSGRAKPAPAGLRLIVDRHPDCGPLGGLDAALAEARDDAVIVMACDMPCVTAPLLAHLVGLAGEAQAVVPRTERGYHPLCAVYSRTCRHAVGDRLASRRLSLMGLLEDVTVRIVEPSELEPFGAADFLLTNVNTPAELHAVEARQGHLV